MHPATKALLSHFTYDHLPPHLQDVSRPFCELAESVATDPNLVGSEVTVALRKLLEGKDAAVRAAVEAKRF